MNLFIIFIDLNHKTDFTHMHIANIMTLNLISVIGEVQKIPNEASTHDECLILLISSQILFDICQL